MAKSTKTHTSEQFIVWGFIVSAVLLSYLLARNSGLFRNEKTVRTLPKVTVAKASLVSGFPEFPQYPQAKLSSSQYMQAMAEPVFQPASYQAYLETTAPVNTVMAWYVTELKKNGWTMEQLPAAGDKDDQNLSARKDTSYATVNAEEENGHVTIVVYVRT